MAVNTYIPFYPSDWLAGTRGLTAAETGIYITLIAMMYERGEPLAMDRGRLARLCGATSTNFNKALTVLIDEGKIEETDNGLWNERVAEVLSRVLEKRNAASQSAKSRWAEKPNKNNGGDDANASSSQCDRNAIQSPKLKENIKRKKQTRKTRIAEDASITSKQIEIAADEGYGEAEARAQFKKFRDSCVANGRTYANWDAAWRNWFRSEYFKPILKSDPQQGGDFLDGVLRRHRGAA